MGLNVIDGTLMSIEDAAFLCQTELPVNSRSLTTTNCPNYLFETTYWLGSVGYCSLTLYKAESHNEWISGETLDFSYLEADYLVYVQLLTFLYLNYNVFYK